MILNVAVPYNFPHKTLAWFTLKTMTQLSVIVSLCVFSESKLYTTQLKESLYRYQQTALMAYFYWSIFASQISVLLLSVIWYHIPSKFSFPKFEWNF